MLPVVLFASNALRDDTVVMLEPSAARSAASVATAVGAPQVAKNAKQGASVAPPVPLHASYAPLAVTGIQSSALQVASSALWASTASWAARDVTLVQRAAMDERRACNDAKTAPLVATAAAMGNQVARTVHRAAMLATSLARNVQNAVQGATAMMQAHPAAVCVLLGVTALRAAPFA
eukprot:gnl/TRDRNA2_/TRDRNA2_134850_c2_seq1.p2 gnl/TRDRNA2_/TRDRNA2_134850_c2~~gnl/TRDRNA2_/TRDRNA2_134850_c2_seq1.p2  ORF type:complete len:177 (-),score=34.17 gnl/TRDRNA2_/TRDRNA2_134850_c2_seq1:268-798(-)